MKIIQKPVSKLTAYEKNSRTHSDEQIDQICASIKEFGFTNPVLINPDNRIIAGHGRVMAAERMGVDKVPCIVLEGLTEAQERAYVIADNQLTLNASWDYEILKYEISELSDIDYDVNLLGVDLEQLFPEFPAGTENDQGSLSDLDPKMITCPHCNKEFDARET